MQRQQGEVLVIDGSPEVREMLQLILDDEGLIVSTVPDTDAGISILHAQRHPITVLFDVVPLLSLTRAACGLGLLDAVRREADQLGRHTYVLMSTSPEQAVTMAGAAPMCHIAAVLRKPFDLDTLLTTVGRATHATRERCA